MPAVDTELTRVTASTGGWGGDLHLKTRGQTGPEGSGLPAACSRTTDVRDRGRHEELQFKALLCTRGQGGVGRGRARSTRARRGHAGPEMAPLSLCTPGQGDPGKQGSRAHVCACVHAVHTHVPLHGCAWDREGPGASPLTSPFSTRGFTSARSTSCSSRDMSLLSPA